jgi:hypothetical protein
MRIHSSPVGYGQARTPTIIRQVGNVGGALRSPATYELKNSLGFAFQKAWVFPVKRPGFCLSKGIGFSCQKAWVLPFKRHRVFLSKTLGSTYQKPSLLYIKREGFISQKGTLVVYKRVGF